MDAKRHLGHAVCKAVLQPWVAVAILVGFVPFLFASVIQLLIADVIVMGFILTNHSFRESVMPSSPRSVVVSREAHA